MTATVITQLRDFLDRWLKDEENMALQAGHGFIDILEERNAGWTDLDSTENVRLHYDARMVRNFSPDRVLAECAAKRDVIRTVAGTDTEEVVLRALASVYSGRSGYGEWDPAFERSSFGGSVTTTCTTCGDSTEILSRDRAHQTAASWEAEHARRHAST